MRTPWRWVGHCADFIGDTVRNNGDVVGSIVERQFIEEGPDLALIGGRSYSPLLYFGPTNNSLTRAVRGTETSVPGLSVCFSGAFTGENCAARVENTNGCAFFDDTQKTTCGLDVARSTNGRVLAGRGDSGGPVATSPSVDAAFVVGSIIGGNEDLAVYHPFALILPIGWRVRTCLAVC